MSKSVFRIAAVAAGMTLALAASAKAVEIEVGEATGNTGETVMVDVTLSTEGEEVAGTQNDITTDPGIAIAAKAQGTRMVPDCTANPDINKTGTSFAFQPSGCTPGTDCTGVRALVLSLSDVEPIPDGSVLYSCKIAIATDADGGAHTLSNTNTGSSDPDGNALTTTGVDGRVTVGGSAAAATIVVGNAEGDAGATVDVEVSLNTQVEVAGTQNDITFASPLAIAAKAQGTRMVPDCTANPDINKGGTSFAFQPSNCTPGTDCTGVRALVLSLSDVEPIPDGSVLYTCKVAIASDAESGDFPLTCTNPGSSDPDGGALDTECTDGTITVGGGGGGTPTTTPTNTPEGTGGTPTNTVSAAPTSTPTSGGGTPTRTVTIGPPPGGNDDDGCAIVAPAQSGSAWMLLLPAAALLWLRRRSR